MSAWAIIPARGGSSGIPRKNLCPVGGVPLIVRTVHAARMAQAVSQIIVSTDDKEIADCAAAHGARIIHRPVELARHDSPSEAALLHALGALQRAGETPPELIAMLQCTSPFTTAEDIDKAIDRLLSTRADSLFSGFEAHYFLWEQENADYCKPLNHRPFTLRPMRQSRNVEIVENGAIYLMRHDGFLRHQTRFFGKVSYYLMPSMRSLDIDTPIDLAFARSTESNL